MALEDINLVTEDFVMLFTVECIRQCYKSMSGTALLHDLIMLTCQVFDLVD